jgi:hypothetical protein
VINTISCLLRVVRFFATKVRGSVARCHFRGPGIRVITTPVLVASNDEMSSLDCKRVVPHAIPLTEP